MGDGIQAAKAGILEVGDLFVVNKADRDGADATVREIRHMISLAEGRQPGDWRPSVTKTVASTGEGMDELMAALDKHHEWLRNTGTLRERRVRRAADEIQAIAVARLRERMGHLHHGSALDDLAAGVVDGTSDPYSAADELVDAVTA
jgi:LAO/AO transport system kinase